MDFLPRRLPRFALALSFAILLVSGTVAVSQSASAPTAVSGFSLPQAPGSVKTELKRWGVQVTWQASPAASPEITHYVVHSGRGSCPVTVPGDRTSAFLPFTKGRVRYWPKVQAVNAYGFSGAAEASRQIVLRKPRKKSDYRNVQILQISDFHGALEESEQNAGAAKLATAFDIDRGFSKSTFTVSSGDNIGGGPIISSYFDEVPSIRALNKMGLEVSTFGNHEHDRPLSHLQQMIGLSRFDWTVANYSNLEPLNTSFSNVTGSVLLKRAGMKVGFVGMNTEDTASLVPPGNLDYGTPPAEIVISPDVAALNAAAKSLRKRGADVVIALLHQGWSTSENGKALGRLVSVTRQLKGFDATFGGHTHQTFASVVGGKLTAQPRNSGQEYTRTQVCVNTARNRVMGSSVQFVTRADLEGVAEDPAIASMVKQYQQEIAPVFDRKVGEVDGIFPRGSRQEAGSQPTGPVERTGETQLGNLAADALRARYGTDFVFINGGGIRDTLPANGYVPNDPDLRRPGNSTDPPFDVTLGDIKTVFPFGNSAAVTKMSGEQLWGALEHAVSSYPSGRFPQISGFRFTFDLTRPAGDRVTAVTDPEGGGILPDQTMYSVTTIDFMAFGGDGFVGFFNPEIAQIREPYDEALTGYLTAELESGRSVPVGPLDGRITCIGVQECVPRDWP